MKSLFPLFLLIITSACSFSPQTEQVDANQTLETIFKRKSVRSYTKHPVAKEKIDLLVRAGMAAPSSRDRRPWEFIVVTDRNKLDVMAEGLPFAHMLKEAQVAIIVCGDTTKSNNSWFLDCSAASENILLAAESMGLGAVWTAAYPYADRISVVSRTLHLPENILPLNVIPIGYPSDKQTPKNKYNPKQIHYDGW